MKQETFVSQISYLSAAYDREVSELQAAVYFKQLGEVPDQQFINAVEMHVNRSRFFPTVAELRELLQYSTGHQNAELLSAPQVSTDSVLREHARLIGVDEDKYVIEHMQIDD